MYRCGNSSSLQSKMRFWQNEPKPRIEPTSPDLADDLIRQDYSSGYLPLHTTKFAILAERTQHETKKPRKSVSHRSLAPMTSDLRVTDDPVHRLSPLVNMRRPGKTMLWRVKRLRPSPQLQCGHTKDAAKRNRPNRAGVHPRRLECGGKPMCLGETDCGTVGFRHIDEYLSAAGIRNQSVEDILGASRIVGDKRGDLVAFAAGANNAPRGKPSIANERAPGMPGSADPGAQEISPRRRKDAGIISFDQREGKLLERQKPRRWRRSPIYSAAVSNVAVGQGEPRLFVVFLLRHDTVEPDDAPPACAMPACQKRQP